MENLFISSTNRTPEIAFNCNGTIRIKGRSIPEDAGLFYNKLNSWIVRYCMNPLPETVVTIEMEYMNSGSAKSILHLLSELCSLIRGNRVLIVNWYYEAGDEDMLEKGEYFQHVLRHKFVFVEV